MEGGWGKAGWRAKYWRDSKGCSSYMYIEFSSFISKYIERWEWVMRYGGGRWLVMFERWSDPFPIPNHNSRQDKNKRSTQERERKNEGSEVNKIKQRREREYMQRMKKWIRKQEDKHKEKERRETRRKEIHKRMNEWIRNKKINAKKKREGRQEEKRYIQYGMNEWVNERKSHITLFSQSSIHSSTPQPNHYVPRAYCEFAYFLFLGQKFWPVSRF